MARNVYSKQLLEATILGAGNATYTVPLGFTAVVRDIDVTVDDVGPLGAAILLVLYPLGATIFEWHITPYTTRPCKWSGRLVLDVPQLLTFSQNGGASEVDCVISGYELALP